MGAANNAIVVILPGVVLAAAAALVLVVDLFTARKAVLAWLAAAGFIATAAVAAGQWVRFADGGILFNARKPETGFAGMVSLDKYALFCTVLFCAIGLATVMLSDSFLARRRAARGEFYVLLMLIVTGMIGMVISTDLIAFFVSFELMSLPTYVLAGYLLREERSGEAAIKYLITGAFSSAILAFGMALLYAATGQTSYVGIAHGLAALDAHGLDARGLLVVAFVLLVTGYGFKISAVPFHSWAPDVYEGAPTPVTAFMSTGVKAAAFAGFAKLFMLAAGVQWQLWVHTMTILAVITMVVGNVLALPQRNIKRMLAYSSIAHAGYLTLGLIAAGTSGTWEGISAILFYLVTYALMNLGAFGVLVWIRNKRAFDYSLDGIAGLGRTMPWPAMLMGVLMVSLTGIPPTAGFWGKFYLFTAVINADLTWLAIIAVVMSAVSAYYYLRVVWFMYFREAEPAAAGSAVAAAPGAPSGAAVPGAVFATAPGDSASYPGTSGAPVEPRTAAPRQPGQAGVVWAVSLCAFGVIAVGMFPAPLLRFAEGALRLILG